MEIKELKKQIVLMAHRAGGGHIPSALSILPIITTMYRLMTPDDRFILSKGHGCLALYVVLMELGLLSPHSKNVGELDSILGGHPDRNKVPGVLCSTGSLGHGLPQAVGIALAKKIKGEPGQVFCLVGDGECDEGSVWEAASIAVNHALNNLTVLVDDNQSSINFLGDLEGKFKAFGFNGVNRPLVIVWPTKKGDGVKRMADKSWHHRAPTDAELAEILEELS